MSDPAKDQCYTNAAIDMWKMQANLHVDKDKVDVMAIRRFDAKYVGCAWGEEGSCGTLRSLRCFISGAHGKA